MDPILAALPPSLLSFFDGQLSNDEVSSDKEMLEHFINSGLTDEQAGTNLSRPVSQPLLFGGPHTNL